MRRFAILLLALSATACRDGAAPFSPIALPADSGGRLTYNLNGDHVPTFNVKGDSIFYAAWTYPSLPVTKGMLLTLSSNGGTVSPILPSLQVGVSKQPWLTAPAISPDGSRIAFFDMTDVRDHEVDYIRCNMPPLTQVADTFATNSILVGATLRVRKPDAVNDDAQLTISFAGRTYNPNLPGSIANIAYPFQRLFEGEGVPFFRASWSPDGTRLVFSDGASLRLWSVAATTSTVIVGTDEGILPAWSPDGNWIAFSKPFKGGTQSVGCHGYNVGAALPAQNFDRTIYTPLTRENAQLFMVHPDGTGLKALGIGDSPAWTSDSKTIIAHRNGNLYKIAADTGAGTLIDATADAFEPALSRDGSELTFSRRKEIGVGVGELNSKGQYNIWVAPF